MKRWKRLCVARGAEREREREGRDGSGVLA